MSGRDVGAMGEATFSRWCSSVGLHANGSRIDKTGWDFLVEFPWKQAAKLPRDLLPAPIECRVQIKPTDQKKKGVAVKLSALNRLVKAPIPTFFCFIEFNGQNQEQAAYLVHVGKEIIEEALKRTRELESQGKGSTLNKSTVFISYGKKHQLDPANGESLKRSIEQYIPDGLEKYFEEKTKLLKTLGFEQGVALVNITFPADSIEKLVDSALGLCDEVLIERSIGHHSRFGILSSEPFLEFDEALLSLQAKPVKAVLRFKEYTFSPGICFDAELVRSPFDQVFPEEFAKARVKSKFFDFVFKSNRKHEFSCGIEGDDVKYSLNEIRDYLKIVSVLQSSSDDLIVEIEWKDKDTPTTLRFSLQGKAEDSNVAIAYQLAITLSSLLQVFHLADHQFFLSFSELLSALEVIPTLHHYCSIKNGTGEILEVIGAVESASNRTAMIGFVQADIGRYTFGICLGILGTLTLVDEQNYGLVAEKYLVYAPVVAQENRAIDPAVIAENLSQFAQQLKQDQYEVITTDFA